MGQAGRETGAAVGQAHPGQHPLTSASLTRRTPADRAASSTCSATVMVEKTEDDWKVRPTPRRERRCGGREVTA
ncbi:hypothetical protein ACR6C2_38205 [Streptomyces sp. INA 01156]